MTSTRSRQRLRAKVRTGFRVHLDAKTRARFKIWGTLIGLSALLIFGGHVLADRYGALVGFFLALALNAWVIWTVDWRLLHLFKSTELEGQDAWGIVHFAHGLAARNGLPPPRLHVIRCSPTAYSAGIFLNRTHIFLSRELLERFEPEEVQAVIAVELARVKHQNISLATASCALVNLPVALASLIDQTFFLQGFRTPRPGQIRPIRFLIAPFVGAILRATLSHAQILQADRAAGQWMHSPQIVAQTLAKIDSYQKTRPLLVGIGDAHLFTVSPLLRFSWCRFLHTQPDISARIAALTGHLYL